MTARAASANSGAAFPNAGPNSRAGVGLKPQHYQHILDHQPTVGWFEIHPENYMCDGGPRHRYLTAIREHYPLSMHGVGLSLGSYQLPDADHIQRLQQLIDRYQPFQVSEHVSWSLAELQGTQIFHHDLLPLPYTRDALDTLCRNVSLVQDALQRPLLMENPSTYLAFQHADYDEPAFLNELVARTGCRLLMDVNNVFVRASNHNFSAANYLADINWQAVDEIHLAGHAIDRWQEHEILVDDHGSAVCDDVWQLYRQAIALAGDVPTLIEWDSLIPDFDLLQAQAEQANHIKQQILNHSAEATHVSLA